MSFTVKPTRLDYEAISSLGRGTFGDVTKAKSIASGKVFAVKQLRNTYDMATFDRLREIIFYRNVPPHESIIALHEMFQDTESLNVVLVLECMRGDLYKYLGHQRRKNRGGLDAAFAGRMMCDILRGIVHIHHHGFVHRDIKPENILFCGYHRGDFHLKLADFGLSREMDHFDNQNKVTKRKWTGYVATRWYRAPEQLLELPFHGPKLDVWAAALILFEICNLEPMFPGSNSPDMISRLLSVLGVPSNHAVGGPSEDALEALQAGPFMLNYAKVPHSEFFRSKSHNIFLGILFGGLQWDPQFRYTADEMLHETEYVVSSLYRRPRSVPA